MDLPVGLRLRLANSPGSVQTMMHNFDPYVIRPIEFIDQVNSKGWRIKVYGISATSKPLPKGCCGGNEKRFIALTAASVNGATLRCRFYGYSSEAWINTVLC